MSRSIRQTPVFHDNNVESEQPWKKLVHGARRVRARTALQGADAEGLTYVEANAADKATHAKGAKKFSPVMRVRQVGRALKILSSPVWARGERAVHQAMGK